MNRQKADPAAMPVAVLEKNQSDKNQRAVILDQLAKIQNSRSFGNSARAKEFFSYVVKQAVDGHTENLKERAIGVNLFDRAPSYMTGEDPIVRVNAAEVRKRLSVYYAEEEPTPEVRIEIPVGSYIPLFHWNPSAHPKPATAENPAVPLIAPKPRLRAWAIAAAAIVLIVLGIVAAITTRKHVQQQSQLDEFWAPVLATGQPVLICISSPVVYEPNESLYAKADQAHPGLYDRPEKRAVNPLQLEPNTPIEWKDFELRADIFVNKVHIYNAALLSVLFERLHKASQVKVGSDFSYNDLQNSPTVLLGAFENPWSIRMAADLPYYLDDENYTIAEKGGQRRVWRIEPVAVNTKDFAIVARLLNSKTGQFQVIIAGIDIPGTEAAGKLVTSHDILSVALRSAPSGWQNKNLEFVIETDVIDRSDSSMRVVAVKAW